MLTMSPDTLLTSLSPGRRAFERLCKWALENVPEYRQVVRRVGSGMSGPDLWRA